MSELGAEIRIGVSSCLLGERVRFDGGHKRNDFITGVLAGLATLVPVCPEVEIGLGTPRETLNLVCLQGKVRLIATQTRLDHTEKMRSFAARKVAELGALNLSGYILKKDSPSCGLECVPVHDAGDVVAKYGRGLFAEALVREFPLLPVEEEGRLQDARLCASFIERVLAYHRLRNFFSSPWTTSGLIRFHTAQKSLLVAHDPVASEKLGRLVAGAKRARRKDLASQYQAAFMAALAKTATRNPSRSKRGIPDLLH
jgi:uncharacterized protein YbbK (DUF523 family)